MRRFFLGDNRIEGETGRITGDLFRHIATVLRLPTGAQVTLADRNGIDFDCQIDEIGPDFLFVTVLNRRTPEQQKPFPAIILLQGLPKGDKLELILQKGTELGIAAFRPFIAERSISRPDPQKLFDKRKRWEKIVMEAARQSHATHPPSVIPATNLKEALTASPRALKLLLWEEENRQSLRNVIEVTERPEEVVIIVGPEGGITPHEARTAIEAGCIPVTLGTRILRTETAGLAVVSILQFVWGDLG